MSTLIRSWLTSLRYLATAVVGIAFRIVIEQLDLAPCHLVIRLFERELETVEHVLAGLGEDSGERTEETHADRLLSGRGGRDEQREREHERQGEREAERSHASLLAGGRRANGALRYLLASLRVKGGPARGKCGIPRVMTNVGLVGLGLLGHALATRLRAAGHAVIGYDVLPERRDALVALGGVAASAEAEVATRSEVVCIVLPSLAAVEEVVTTLDAARVVIQMSTISPGLTERLARLTGERGQAFLDCPVSGTAGMVARGDGVIFVGGDHAIYDRWRPILEAMLPRVVHVGQAGQAMTLKLVANLLVGVHSAAAAEALAMARRAGLDMEHRL